MRTDCITQRTLHTAMWDLNGKEIQKKMGCMYTYYRFTFLYRETKRCIATISRRQWHSTPVLLPRKSHGRRSLVGCSPWSHQESDTTEQLHFYFSLSLFTFMHWRRKWQRTPIFLPGESQGLGSLEGCSRWG